MSARNGWGLDEDQMACRDLQHSWAYLTAEKVAGGFERRLSCRSCGGMKIQVLDTRGYLMRTKYVYPEGYVRPAGSGRISREENAAMRLANLVSRTRKGRNRRA